LGELTVRLSDELHERVRIRARELGKSVNAYITRLLSDNLDLPPKGQPEKETDKILRHLLDFIAKHGRPMTFSEAMMLFRLSYQQLYRKYKPYLIPDRKRGEAEAQARELEATVNEEQEGKEDKEEGTSLSNFWGDGS